MLPFLNMNIYKINPHLFQYIEKMKNNILTIEDILEEDDIIKDLKDDINSQFLCMLSNEAIRKLMDYATKVPQNDSQKLGHKYPFNATEILIANNPEIQSRIMHEIKFKKSEFYGEEEEEGGEDDEDSETVSIFDNIEHLFQFLKGPKDKVSNYVLVGYFSKILNHLINFDSSSYKIVQYIFNYQYKNKFDLLDAFIQNLNKKVLVQL